jgi:hypothetical protein
MYVYNEKSGSWTNGSTMAYRPVVYLKSDVRITGGNGTSSNPYTFDSPSVNTLLETTNPVGITREEVTTEVVKPIEKPTIVAQAKKYYPLFKVMNNDTSRIIDIKYNNDLINQYSLDLGSTWLTYLDMLTIDKNSIILARTLDNDGNIVDSSSLTITTLNE